MESQEIVTGYKATDENMCCRGFQFEIGKWYECDGDLVLCENGFHFCEHPSGPWTYYSSGRLFKVEAQGVVASTGPGADLKHVARKIRLVEELVADGDRNTGNGNTGDENTGDENTGYRNAGNGNTGNWNTGNGNTGDENTGDENTGDWNTGNGNTGNGNCGNFHSGSLCHGPAPFFLFNLPTDRDSVDFYLVHELSNLLQNDKDIDPAPFLGLPNATPERIKELHEAHKAARAK